jgi:hypothetical protein
LYLKEETNKRKKERWENKESKKARWKKELK